MKVPYMKATVFDPSECSENHIYIKAACLSFKGPVCRVQWNQVVGLKSETNFIPLPLLLPFRVCGLQVAWKLKGPLENRCFVCLLLATVVSCDYTQMKTQFWILNYICAKTHTNDNVRLDEWAHTEYENILQCLFSYWLYHAEATLSNSQCWAVSTHLHILHMQL